MAFPAPDLDIKLEKGADFQRVFTWLTEDENGTRTAVDLTGFQSKMQIRESYDSPITLVNITDSTDKNTVGKITIGFDPAGGPDDPTNGNFQVYIPNEVINIILTTCTKIKENFKNFIGFYDLFFTNSLNNEIRFLRGKAFVEVRITQ